MEFNYSNPVPVAEAFQTNGVWYQDYEVTDSSGARVVKRFLYNGVNWVLCNEQVVSSKIDFSKKIPETKAGISLKKNVVNLDKTLVSLSKSTGIDMTVHRAKVAAVIDFSGSMRSLYYNGAVQRTLTRLVPLGLRFDDNGEIDVWIFNTRCKRLESLDLMNFENYVSEVIMKSGERFGGTSYSPALTDIHNKYVKEEPSKYPAFVLYITDGSPDDRRVTNKLIQQLSEYNIFIQFIGLGVNDDFDYLKRLDDLPGRKVDNTGFTEVADFDKLTDDELYNKLLEQYIDWLKAMNIK